MRRVNWEYLQRQFIMNYNHLVYNLGYASRTFPNNKTFDIHHFHLDLTTLSSHTNLRNCFLRRSITSNILARENIAITTDWKDGSNQLEPKTLIHQYPWKRKYCNHYQMERLIIYQLEPKTLIKYHHIRPNPTMTQQTYTHLHIIIALQEKIFRDLFHLWETEQ